MIPSCGLRTTFLRHVAYVLAITPRCCYSPLDVRDARCRRPAPIDRQRADDNRPSFINISWRETSHSDFVIAGDVAIGVFAHRLSSLFMAIASSLIG